MIQDLQSLPVEEEDWCDGYDRREYRYDQRVEKYIAARQGGVFCPYVGMCLTDLGKTDIEHIVAVSEAHASGLCKKDKSVKRQFANDIEGAESKSVGS